MISRSFSRKLDALHLTHVVEAEPDPATMSPRDCAIWYWKKWDLSVETRDGMKRAHELTEDDWAVIIYSPRSKEWMTFRMPDAPTLEEQRTLLPPAIEPAAPVTQTQPEPAEPTPSPPPQPSASPWEWQPMQNSCHDHPMAAELRQRAWDAAVRREQEECYRNRWG